MVTRTDSTDKPVVNCVVQVILKAEQGLKTYQVILPLEFFTYEIMVKAINFMPDKPPGLLDFVDTLRRESKTD